MDGGWAAKMVAIEEAGEQKPFVALDDLERLAADETVRLALVFSQLRKVFESWEPRAGGVFIRKQFHD
jgi:hypothetical protein